MTIIWDLATANSTSFLISYMPHNLLIWTTILFSIGLFGVILNSGNFIITMLCLELIYISFMVNFIILSSTIPQSNIGWIAAFISIVLAACESAIGLGLIISIAKFEETLNFFEFNWVRG